MCAAVPFDPGIAASAFIVLVFLLASTSGTSSLVSNQCHHEQCSSNYQREKEASVGGHKEASPAYCSSLRRFLQCLRSKTQPCLGVLTYHTNLLIVKRLLSNLDCETILRASTVTTSQPSTSLAPEKKQQPPLSTNPPFTWITASPPRHLGTGTGSEDRKRDRQCGTTPAAGSESVFCSLFGDPHVRTFDGRYQTCRTRGAWPLIDNAYLAVQVTNEAVAAEEGDSDTPTVPSQITVIIKEVPGCTSQLTYEASSLTLPSTFVDGSRQSSPTQLSSASSPAGAGAAVTVLVKEPGSHVRLRLLHVNSTVVLRRTDSGQLSVAAQLPAAVAATSSSSASFSHQLQLCANGCPTSQRISTGRQQVEHTSAAGGGSWPPPRKLQLVRNMCEDQGLAGFFLDACVFDAVFGAGNVAGFTQSAVWAQQDLHELAPQAADDQLQLVVAVTSAAAVTTSCSSSLVWLLLVAAGAFV